MPKYLYIFGYETPEQLRINKLHGWGDEDSKAVFITSTSEPEALLWGQEISQQFLKWLFQDENIDWSVMNYASWIESKPEYPPDTIATIPIVLAGEYPDFWKLDCAIIVSSQKVEGG